MITLCHAAKGGSGTTVVACSHAINSPGPSLLVDLEGDVPLMLGLAEPDRPGVIDWLDSQAPPDHLDDLLVDVTRNCAMLPARDPTPDRTVTHIGSEPAPERWGELFEWLTRWGHDTGGAVVIDAGTTRLPSEFVERCPRRWLVTRACYLALRHAGRLPVPPTGTILIDEPGRSLGRRDVEHSTRAPIVATIAWDYRVARSVDAGLLHAGRLPRGVHRALARVAA